VDLEFSEDEAALRDSARDVVDGISPPSVVRALYEGTGDAVEVWRQMVALDWPGLAIGEEHGGVGMGFLELAIVAEQLGRATVPGPFLATATQFAPAVRELGDEAAQKRLLPRVAAGEVTGTLAVAEGGSWRLDRLGRTLTATPDGSGWTLSGRKDRVLDGATADEVVVLARAEAGIGAFLLRRDQVTVEPRPVLDATMPLADLVFDGVRVEGDDILAGPGPEVEARAARALEEATVVLAIQTVGACRAILEQTVAYAKERVQYERPIGSFQALKHRMADMYLAVERASALGWYAALTIAEESDARHEAASLAKVAAGECQQLVVTDGLQLHGGIGFTWENDLQFLLKRARCGNLLFGDDLAHAMTLAARLGLTEVTA
jgi:alkylation response protein AidB-like acyl-CoA dehydrogenase